LIYSWRGHLCQDCISWEEEWQNKIWIEKERFMMLVKGGRNADRHCFRRDVGMGSRSEKQLDDWGMILDTSFADTEVKELSIVGVFFCGIWGDDIVGEDFQAVCSLRILSEKKVTNICDSDWEEAIEGSRRVGLCSRRVLMEFQSLRGFEEEEAIKEALKRFLAAITAEW